MKFYTIQVSPGLDSSYRSLSQPSSEGHLQVWFTFSYQTHLVEFGECSDVPATLAPSCSVHRKNYSGESALNQWKMFPRRLGRLFSSTPFPSFPFFVPGHWSAPGSPPSDTCAHSRAKRGNESFAVGDHDCRILILKMNVHIFRSLVEQKTSWPTQGLPNKISWGSGTSLASYSS